LEIVSRAGLTLSSTRSSAICRSRGTEELIGLLESFCVGCIQRLLVSSSVFPLLGKTWLRLSDSRSPQSNVSLRPNYYLTPLETLSRVSNDVFEVKTKSKSVLQNDI
jgi:hypothetical protein